jgi:phosphoribosylaminoimidazolecarboxamide formyltransferase/IMP cyclohydrolase
MLQLRYGINPQLAARVVAVDDCAPPIQILSGRPSYINLLDALNAWQLVREAGASLGRPVATSFKHVSPAGAAASGGIDTVMREIWDVDPSGLSPAAAAYIRARDCDPKSSFGDFVGVSVPVDPALAHVLASVVSDGVIAPGFEPGVIGVLSKKKGGSFVVIEADPNFEPPEWERREVLGVGAGQQSRVDCTKLAGAKVDTWWLRRHPAVRSVRFRSVIRRQDRINWQVRYIEGDLMSDERQRLNEAVHKVPEPISKKERSLWLQELAEVAMAADGFIPFRDNIDHAVRHGVRYIAHPGGSTRTEEIGKACAEHGVVLVSTGMRLFHH